MLQKDKFVKNLLEKGEEIVAYQRPIEDGKHKFFFEVKVFQQKRTYTSWLYASAPSQICNSRLFLFDKTETIRSIKK